MRDLIRRRPLVTFYVAAVLIGISAIVFRDSTPEWFVAFMKWLQERQLPGNVVTLLIYSVENQPAFLKTLLFPAAPTIAALLIVTIGWGRAGLVELFSRLLPWRGSVGWRRGLAVYGTMTVIYIALALLMMVRAHQLGSHQGLDMVLASLGTLPIVMLGMLAALPYVDGGAMLEELGWRGYMLPRMLEFFRTPLVAAVVLGVLWGLWHMPRDLPVFMAGSEAFASRFGGLGGYVQEWVTFCLGTVMLTIICTYAFNVTGGSALAAILVHGAANTISVNILRLTGGRMIEWGGITWDVTDLYIWPIAIAIVVLAGPQLGRIAAPANPQR
jgi:membrane protease YdiL (CAAX protease family)